MSPRNASPTRKARDRNSSPAPTTESSRICEDTWVPLGDAIRRVLAKLERERADVGRANERRPLIARPGGPSEARAQARTRNLTCRRCGKPIVHRGGRRPTYCSDKCGIREFDRRRVKKAAWGVIPEGQRNAQK